jgi:hypothetical protein
MYGRVFQSLWRGSMRGQSDAILVFVHMLSNCDRTGVVDYTQQTIADETGLPLERVCAAISALEGPDPHSRTPTNEGRRIERVDPGRSWGWHIVNHALYRAMRTRDDTRDRVARHRACNGNVTQCNAM